MTTLALSPAAYLDHIRTESRRFRDVLSTCDPVARVPSCPDWDAADLLWHLTGVQRFWAEIVEKRPAPPAEDAPEAGRPAGQADLLAAFDAASAALTGALEAADPADEAWHWAPVQTVGTTLRRQAHEALIHRLDAEQAAGEVTPLDRALAADGVLELLEVMYGGEAPAWGRIEHSDRRVRLDLTDVGTSIWVEPCTFLGTHPESGTTYDGPHVLVVDDPGREPDALVRGTAEALDVWLWQRSDDSEISVTGDPEAFEAFLAAVTQPLD